MENKQIYTSVGQMVGGTPIVQIPTYPYTSALVLVKLEGGNPGGSIKDRPAKHIIEVAEQEGRLQPYRYGQTLLECSGGSMANGLLTAAQNKYHCIFVVPSNYPDSKIALLKARGADVIKADCRKGNDAHYQLAKKMAAENPDYFFTDQLHNPANPEAHYLYTGPEIIDQLGGEKIDYFITGIGSGGTISGVGKRLKEKYPSVKIIGVQPVGCDVVNGKAVKHRIQGWGVGLRPATLNDSILDGVMDVCYWDAIAECDTLNIRQGLFLGVSSGANIHAAKKLATMVGPTKTILTLSPDGGGYYIENYLEFRQYVKNINY